MFSTGMLFPRALQKGTRFDNDTNACAKSPPHSLTAVVCIHTLLRFQDATMKRSKAQGERLVYEEDDSHYSSEDDVPVKLVEAKASPKKGRSTRRAVRKMTKNYKDDGGSDDEDDEASDYEQPKAASKKKPKKASKRKRKHKDPEDTDSTADDSQTGDIVSPQKNSFFRDMRRASASLPFAQDGGDWRATAAIDY